MMRFEPERRFQSPAAKRAGPTWFWAPCAHFHVLCGSPVLCGSARRSSYRCVRSGHGRAAISNRSTSRTSRSIARESSPFPVSHDAAVAQASSVNRQSFEPIFSIRPARSSALHSSPVMRWNLESAARGTSAAEANARGIRTCFLADTRRLRRSTLSMP